MRDIINIIRRTWREICCIFLLTFLIYSSYVWYADPPEISYRAWLLLATNIAELILLTRLIVRLWQLKWKRAAARGAQKLFAAVSRLMSSFFDRYLSKWFGTKNTKNLISGSTKITLDQIVFEKKTPKRRLPKWKNLQNSRERLGFLYRHMINSKLRAGEAAFPHDTPSEIRAKSENSPHEEKLFELYIASRYDERSVPPSAEIEELKNKFEIK